MVAAAFWPIFALGTAREVEARWDEVADILSERFPKAATSMRDARTDVLAFRAFSRAHWRKIWSNNSLERLDKDVKRRANVVGMFPNDRAAIRLIRAVLADQHEEWAIARPTSPKPQWLTSTNQTTPATPNPPSPAEPQNRLFASERGVRG